MSRVKAQNTIFGNRLATSWEEGIAAFLKETYIMTRGVFKGLFQLERWSGVEGIKWHLLHTERHKIILV